MSLWACSRGREHIMVIHSKFCYDSLNKTCEMTTGHTQLSVQLMQGTPACVHGAVRGEAWHLDFTCLSEMIALNLNEACLEPPRRLCLLRVPKNCPSRSPLALVPLICILENEAAHWLFQCSCVCLPQSKHMQICVWLTETLNWP